MTSRTAPALLALTLSLAGCATTHTKEECDLAYFGQVVAVVDVRGNFFELKKPAGVFLQESDFVFRVITADQVVCTEFRKWLTHLETSYDGPAIGGAP